jgi:ribosomal protein S18 acetylase RimI-like enzyme
MNEIIYKTTNEIPTTELDNLIKSVGWGTRGDTAWKTILSKSSFLISAWDDNKLVGLGRALEDGIMCMIYDIAVLPEYQEQKIGKHIMEYILKEVSKGEFQSVGLFAWNKNIKNKPFYESFGFKAVNFGMKLNLSEK